MKSSFGGFFKIFKNRRETLPPPVGVYETFYMIAHMCEGFFMKMSIDKVYDFWLVTCHTRQHCVQVLYFYDFLINGAHFTSIVLARFFSLNVCIPSLVFFHVSVSYKTTNGEGFIFFRFFKISYAQSKPSKPH